MLNTILCPERESDEVGVVNVMINVWLCFKA